MLPDIPLYAKKNARIMLDSQNNATLVSENALFNFKQNVETQTVLNSVCISNCLKWKVLSCLFIKKSWYSQNLSSDKTDN